MPDEVAAVRRLSDLGEDALVASVLARYGPNPVGVLLGPGDDAAVLDLAALGGGHLVVSTDTLVEGHDFRREWSSGHDVGVKVAAQTLADVAAMGARPVALLVSLAAPSSLPADWAADLAGGLDEECRRAGAAVVGGDVSAAGQVVLTGTAIGLLPGVAVARSGARPGDVVALAGRPGRSAAGLALLEAGVSALAVDQGEGSARPGGGVSSVTGVLDGLLTAHRAPRPPYAHGPAAAAAGARAMIDTSDGLLRDAERLASASGVVIDLSAAALAPDDDLVAAARWLRTRHATATSGPDPGSDTGPDVGPASGPESGPESGPDTGLESAAATLAASWVLSGGEDHCLLACFPADAALPPGFVPIGVVDAPGAGGLAQVLLDARTWNGSTGWRHFR